MLLNSRENLGITHVGEPHAIQGSARIQQPPSGGLIEPSGMIQIQNRISLRAETGALMAPRQKARAPQPGVEWIIRTSRAPARQQHNIRRQFRRLGSQSIGQPGSCGRPAWQLMPGLQQCNGRVVVDRLGRHRSDNAQSVRLASQVWQQVADRVS